MRAAVLAVSLLSLAALAPPPVEADHTVPCLVNALFIFPPDLVRCLSHAPDGAPLCLQVFERSSGTLKTYPCAAPCAAPPPPGWFVLVAADGAQGDQVSGSLACDGVGALEATAVVGDAGVGVDFEFGPLPNGGTMTCGVDGAVPPTVDSYVVSCAPDP